MAESKKISVGDTVMVPVKVLAIHHQGFPHGVHPDGTPRLPTKDPKEPPLTKAEFEHAHTEQPDTLDCTLDAVGGTMKVFVSAGVVVAAPTK